MKQIMGVILRNDQVGERFFRMRVKSPYIAKLAKPGQFVEVRCGDVTDPLLRRPLGIHRIASDSIELLYEVVGHGTRLLSMKRPGDLADIIGPLGNGFYVSIGQKNKERMTNILVGGGIGVAPLVALAEKLKGTGQPFYVLVGACKKGHILCEKDFKKTGAKLTIATEDGSKGIKGLVTKPLGAMLSHFGRRRSVIFACGPTGMLKAVASLAARHGIQCQVSLEERMACGVGVCLGCPVKVRTANPKPRSAKDAHYVLRSTQYEYKMVCKDGPVFNAEDIIW